MAQRYLLVDSMRSAVAGALPRHFVIALLVLVLLGTGGCAPSSTASLDAGGQSLACPGGVDPRLMQRLAAELRRVLAVQLGKGVRAQSTPAFTPQRSNDGADALLSWEYNLRGDYNQDGLVSINDLTPLGAHFGAWNSDAGWPAASVADGNSDGEVNIADITPIGQNWQASLSEYIVEEADSASGPWVETGRVMLAEGQLPVAGGPLQFSLRVLGGAGRAFYRVHGDDGQAGPGQRLQRLRAISHFMYQIQELDAPGAVDALAATRYDLLVVEPTATNKGSEDFDAAGMVTQLKSSPDSRGGQKLVLAYIDIGEAEDYRTYWAADWVAPTVSTAGVPDFLITVDPDGWSGNYPVAFWDPRWQALIIDDADSLLRQALAAGFDGVYLDWVDAYCETQVVAAAASAGVDPAAEMVALLGHLRDVARQTDPEFLVVQQNAPYLIDEAAGLTTVIDAVGMEDIWFMGEAAATWGDPLGGDIPQDTSGDYSTAALIAQASKYTAAGLPVLTIDYCLNAANAAQVYGDSQSLGFVPLVTQISLEHVTETPPPWY